MAVQIINGQFYADNLSFSGWTPDDEIYLRTLLAQIYATPTGLEIFGQIESAPPLSGIVIKKSVGLSGTDLGTIWNDVWLNPNDTNVSMNPDAKFIDQFGMVHDLEFERLLIHEMIHAITEIEDPVLFTGQTDVSDTYGYVVDKTNKIMAELDEFGMNTYRAGYYAALFKGSRGDEFFDSQNLTGGQEISQVVVLDSIYANHYKYEPSPGQFPIGTVNASLNGDLILGTIGTDTIFGSFGKDFLYGGSGQDFLRGGNNDDYLDGGIGLDTIDYNTSLRSVTITLEGAQLPAPDLSYDILVNDDGTGSYQNGVDKLTSIEMIYGSANSDTLIIDNWDSALVEKLEWINLDDNDTSTVDSAQDSIDVTNLSEGLWIDLRNPDNQLVSLWNHVSADPERIGEILKLMNVENVLGADVEGGEKFDLIMGPLLPKRGSLSPTDQITYDEAKALFAQETGGSPVLVASIFLQAIPLLQQIAGFTDSFINGNGGDDVIYSNKFTSTIDGGGGDDTIIGGGFNTQIYGGEGVDTFKLGPNSFAMDIATDEKAGYGNLGLFGGVQFSWQESGFAYWQPYSALLNGLPTIASHFFETWALRAIDITFMSTFRYAQTESGQLVAQLGRGIGGQAVIENYHIDTSTGAAVGGITVIKVDFEEANSAATDKFYQFAKLVLQQSVNISIDPLVIDLDGDGIELSGRTQEQVYFDLDGDGFGERTGWVRPDDGLLALDVNGDGVINDISELFGDETTPGLTALSALDSNGDGVISSLDAQFSGLLVWQDINQNGISDAGELNDLAFYGISEISLSGSAPTVAASAGNAITEVATVTYADGTTTEIADVTFTLSQIDSQYLGDTTVSGAAAALPYLHGLGDVADLRVVMTDDAALLQKVTDFTALPATSNWSVFKASTAAILIDWAGASGVAATPLGSGGFNLQILAVLEAFAGMELAPRDPGTGAILDTNADELLTMWQDTLANQTARLAFQSVFAGHLTGISYSETEDQFVSASATSLADTLESILNDLPADPVAALAEWQDLWGPALTAMTEAMARHDGFGIRAGFAVGQIVRAFENTQTSAVHTLSLAELIAGLGLDDVYAGTAGDDTLTRASDGGMHVFAGDAGNDTLTGGAGQDVYVFGLNFGQDVVVDAEFAGRTSGDRLRFSQLEQSDVTISRSFDDLLIMVNGTGDSVRVLNQFLKADYSQAGRQISKNWGIEDIQFADGTIFEAAEIAAQIGMGTAGDDVIDGTAFDDELSGGEGNDTLRGGDGGDTYIFGANGGQDVIDDRMTNPFNDRTDLLLFDNLITLDDLLFERDGDSDDLLIKIANTTDSLLILGQFAYSYLGYTSEYSLNYRIEGFGSNIDAPLNWADIQQLVIETYTTEFDDITYGYGTPDYFAASAGDDWMSGGDGGDLYEFGTGSGNDTIDDNQRYQQLGVDTLSDGAQLGAADTVDFGTGIATTDVTFSRIGASDNLFITLANSADTLTVVGQFEGKRLDLFGFYGIAWKDRIEKFDFEDGTTITWEQVLATVTTGSAGDDSLYGAHYADTLTGNAGNDFLSGGDDGDTYVYNLGDGNDVIEDNQYDIFTTADDVLVFGAGINLADITYSYAGLSKNVTINLNDGSTITLQNQFDGYNSHIFGVVWKDRIETLQFNDGSSVSWLDIMHTVVDQQETAGNDTINGINSGFGVWGDTIDGGAGDDTIYGHGGEDTLTGGTGTDFLAGGWGSDTYIFNAGDGNDTIIDDGSGRDSADVVRIQGHAVADTIVSAGAGANDVVISFVGSTDTITVQNALTGKIHTSIETYEFDDGTIWTPDDLAAQLLAGLATSGNDYLDGFGTNDVIDGLAGSDVINGNGGNDTLTGGTGDDTVSGGWGNDTYIFSAGDGMDIVNDAGSGLDRADKLVIHGYAPVDVSLAKEAGTNNVIFTFAGSSDQIKVINAVSGRIHNSIESYEFDDGTVWSAQQLAALVLGGVVSTDSDYLEGSGAAETISGLDGNDVILGDAGDDILAGDAGDDYIDGGTGNDTYVFSAGDGHDTIVDNGNGLDSADKLIIHGYTPAEVSVELTDGTEVVDLVFAGGTDRISLLHPLADGVHRTIETIEFDDGTVWTKSDLSSLVIALQITSGDDAIVGSDIADIIDGGDGDDVISGGSGSDTISGGLGADQIDGNWGNDTYIFSRGDGQDTIVDNGGGLDLSDRLIIHGYTPDEVFVSRIDGTDDILLNFAGTEDSITLDHPITGSAHTQIETYEFDDGTIWTPDDLAARVLLQEITDGDDILQGYAQADVISASIGNDTIYGNGGDDTLSGDLGDDYVDGGTGNDTFIFTRSDGNDTFVDNGNGLSTSDRVVIHGYTPDEVIVQRIAGVDDILLTFEGTDDSITLLHPITGSAHTEIETYEFDDGTIWTPTDLSARILAAETTDGDDVLNGYARADVISGGAGNDTIYGNHGDDTLSGDAGNDYLDGGWGNDTYIFNAGDGEDTLVDSGSGLDFSDRLIIHGYLPSEVTVTSIFGSSDLELTFAGSTDKITLLHPLDSGVHRVIDTYEFDDGTVWTKSDLAALVVAPPLDNDGDDTMIGTSGADVLDGGLGNDILHALDGSDTYIFNLGYGQDYIEDNGRRDTDVLSLGGYQLSDVIFTQVNLAGTADNGSSAGDSLKLTFVGTTDQVLIYDTLDGSQDHQIEQIHFDGGTVWAMHNVRAHLLDQMSTAGDDVIEGFYSADVITGGTGNDTIYGRDGSDRYVFNVGDGQDYIQDNGRRDTDVLSLSDYQLSDVIFTQVNLAGTADNGSSAGDSLQLTFAGTTDQVLLYNTLDGSQDHQIEQIHFDGGTVWSMYNVRAHLLDQMSTAGDDIIEGFYTADVITGGTGNDTMYGRDGSDTYVFNAGDGQDYIDDNGYKDTDALVIHGYLPDEVVLRRVDLPGTADNNAAGGDSVELTFIGSTDRVQIYDTIGYSNADRIEQIRFDDGTVWSYTYYLTRAANTDPLAVADTVADVQGGSVLNIAAADLLANDTDANSDPLSVLSVGNAANGTVVLTSSGTIQFIAQAGYAGAASFEYTISDGNAGRSTAQVDLNVIATGTQTSGTINADTLNGTSGIDSIYADDGDDTVSSGAGDDVVGGGAGNDTLNGEGGQDLIAGDAGDDILTGGTESDTFLFTSGFGNDTITDFATGIGSDDIIQLAGFDGLDFSQVVAAATQQGGDVVIDLGTDQTISLTNAVLSDLHEDDFQFV